jgi:hypothetical protein
MTTKTAVDSWGDDPKRLLALIFAGVTVLAVGRKLLRGQRVSSGEAIAALTAAGALWKAFGEI